MIIGRIDGSDPQIVERVIHGNDESWSMTLRAENGKDVCEIRMTARECVEFANELIATSAPLLRKEQTDEFRLQLTVAVNDALMQTRVLRRSDLVDELDQRGLRSWLKGKF